MPIQAICCIGAGYVGGATMAVIADRCPDLQITVVDLNVNRIAAWNDPDLSQLQVYEPRLAAVVKRVQGRNLHLSSAVEESIAVADMVLISVNTPVKQKGQGAGMAFDLKWVESSERTVANAAQGHTIVVEKSALPVRTAAATKQILSSLHDHASFSMHSNTEFLPEGPAIADLKAPDRVLIGGEDLAAVKALASSYQKWVSAEQILTTNLWSSELSKIMANALLAQRISSINGIVGALECAEFLEISVIQVVVKLLLLWLRLTLKKCNPMLVFHHEFHRAELFFSNIAGCVKLPEYWRYPGVLAWVCCLILALAISALVDRRMSSMSDLKYLSLIDKALQAPALSYVYAFQVDRHIRHKGKKPITFSSHGPLGIVYIVMFLGSLRGCCGKYQILKAKTYFIDQRRWPWRTA